MNFDVIPNLDLIYLLIYFLKFLESSSDHPLVFLTKYGCRITLCVYICVYIYLYICMNVYIYIYIKMMRPWAFRHFRAENTLSFCTGGHSLFYFTTVISLDTIFFSKWNYLLFYVADCL